MSTDPKVIEDTVCPECGKRTGIQKAVVNPIIGSATYNVEKYELNCGHELDNPDAEMDSGVVDLFQLQHPEAIEVQARNGDSQ